MKNLKNIIPIDEFKLLFPFQNLCCSYKKVDIESKFIWDSDLYNLLQKVNGNYGVER